MMIVDHMSIGLIIADTSTQCKKFAALLICAFSSIMPDLPVYFIALPGTIEYLSHRMYTHSLLFAPIYSIIPVLLGYLFFKKSIKNNVTFFYIISTVSCISHLFLDLFTPYGIELFYPLSRKVFALDFFHSFDPIFIGISILIIIFIIIKFLSKKNIKTVHIFFLLGLYLVYGLYTGFSKYSFSSQAKNYIAANFPGVNYLCTIPRTFWRWKGICKGPDQYVLVAGEENDFKTIRYSIIKKIPDSIKSDSYYLKFLEYARYPVILIEKRSISLINLIYSQNSYRLSYDIDENGNIQKRTVSGFDLSDKLFH